MDDRRQPHLDLGFRLALGPAFMASILSTVDYKRALGNGQGLSIMFSAEAAPWRHASLDDAHMHHSARLCPKKRLCSDANDMIESSFETSHPSNQAVPRAVQGP